MTRTPAHRAIASSLLAAVLTVSTLAGCAGRPIAGTAAPTTAGPGTTVITTPPTVVSTVRTANRPAQLTGPSRSAQPLLVVNTRPTFYCSTAGTVIPTLVVYDDGVVLSVDGVGAHCDKVPQVGLGWIDPADARAVLDSYFASPESRVDMSTLNVTDMPYSSIDYHSSNGPRSIRVYALGAVDDDYVPWEQRAARRALGALLDTLGSGVRDDHWKPDRVVISASGDRPSHPTDPDGALPRWPIPLTPGVRRVIDGSGGDEACTMITGSDATKVLAAHKDRAAEAGWMVDGKQRWFPIGIVLPTFPPCEH